MLPLLFPVTRVIMVPKKLAVKPRGIALVTELSSFGGNTVVVNPGWLSNALLPVRKTINGLLGSFEATITCPVRGGLTVRTKLYACLPGSLSCGKSRPPQETFVVEQEIPGQSNG